MALQATLTTFHGEITEGVYVRIESQGGIKGSYWASAVAYEEVDGSALENISFSFTYDLSSGRTFEEQAYDALKEVENLSEVQDI